MSLTLQIIDPVFTESGKLTSLKLSVTVASDPNARRPIAETVPLPRAGIPAGCALQENFVNPAALSKSRLD